jgi:CRISPR-associated endonuclease/helicase Cas3
MCTATQPALTRQAGLSAPEALLNVREIVQPDRNLYNRLSRVRSQQAGVLSDQQLVEGLGSVERGLVIVNNRRHARELFGLLQKSGLSGQRHLSTAMTAAHRQQVLAEIRVNLKEKRPVRLVSTSLIEAGVDISFDAVWRAWAGLDQIAQAAGRCNREGELGPLGGKLTIFEPEDREGRKPPRELEQNAATARSVLAEGLDPLSPEAIARYFRELLWRAGDNGKWTRLDNVKVGDDEIRGIMNTIEISAPGLDIRFADIAAAFRMIEDTMVPVIISASVHPVFGAPQALLDSIPHVKSLGGVERKLQRHLVQVPRRARQALIDTGSAHAIGKVKLGDQFVVLSNPDLYDFERGLEWNNPTYRSAESLMF